MSIPFVSLSDTFDQWRSKTNANSVNVGDLVLLTTPVTSDIVSAINEVNQRLINVDQTALREVVEDPTPELGGNLSLNSNDIVGVGNIVINGVISGTIAVGGDLTGTTANAQIIPNSIGITELNLPDGTAGQFLKTDGIGGLSFDTVLTDASNEVVGGDVSGVVSNIQINPNVVGIDELDVSDGNAGQVLSTDGSGTLSFVDGGIGGNAADYEEDILIGDGTTTTFIFPSNVSAPSEEAILVSIDGVIQPTSSYELPLPTSIRFPNTPPDSGATIRVLHLGVVSTASPGSTLFVEDLFDGNGGTDYTLTEDAPVRETILVYVDGVSQPTTEYSLPTLRTIRFVEAPLIGSSVRVVHLGVAQQGLATGSSNFVEDLFLGDGTTDFTLSQPAPTKETILVFVNGVSQPTTIYNLLSSTVIRFLEAPSVNSNVKVLHLGIAGTVADGSITTPKLADNAVTPAKLGAGVILGQTIAPNSVGIPELNVSDGNNGEFLKTNGAGLLEFAAVAASSGGGGGGGLTGMQVFDTLGAFTWTKPTDVKTILYFVTGGGGGTAASGGSTVGSGGGGGGSTAMGFLDVSNITSETGTVGAGGTPNAGVGNAGTGGSSTFGSTITAIGGQGSGVNNQSASGGVSTGGQVNMPGSIGQANDPSLSNYTPGGGISFFAGIGSGGRGSLPPTGAGNAGSDGIVVILEFGGPEETTSSGGGGAASGGVFQGTTEGYKVGGANASGGFVRSQFSIIEAYSFVVDGNVNSQVGNLSQAREASAGFASTTNGYVVGGRIGENSNNLNSISYSGVLDKFSFTTANTVTQPFTLSPFRGGHTGHTSETHGYWGGGFTHDGGTGTGGTSTDTLIVDRVLFASDNSSTNIGDLDIDFQSPYSTSSTTDGYYIGGSDRNTEVFLTTYRKFSFSSESSGTVITNISGNTVRGRQNSASLCGDGVGYITSGVIFPNNVQANEIEKFVYASDVMTIEPRTLVRTHVNLGGTSSTTDGYCHGGTNLSTGSFGSAQTDISNQVQKFSFSNNNNSFDIATLTTATFSTASHIQH